MASYYNPYQYYQPTYTGTIGYPPYTPLPTVTQPQSYTSPTNNVRPIEWVDGEAAARAYQAPPGWPADTPIALWDNTAPYIYFKSWNRMGMPNRIQKIQYDPTPIQDESPNLPVGQNGNSGAAELEKAYVTKEDLAEMKREIQEMIQEFHVKPVQNNQNGSNSSGSTTYRGGRQNGQSTV